jgi:hypothetical protein
MTQDMNHNDMKRNNEMRAATAWGGFSPEHLAI